MSQPSNTTSNHFMDALIHIPPPPPAHISPESLGNMELTIPEETDINTIVINSTLQSNSPETQTRNIITEFKWGQLYG